MTQATLTLPAFTEYIRKARVTVKKFVKESASAIFTLSTASVTFTLSLSVCFNATKMICFEKLSVVKSRYWLDSGMNRLGMFVCGCACRRLLEQKCICLLPFVFKCNHVFKENVRNASILSIPISELGQSTILMINSATQQLSLLADCSGIRIKYINMVLKFYSPQNFFFIPVYDLFLETVHRSSFCHFTKWTYVVRDIASCKWRNTKPSENKVL